MNDKIIGNFKKVERKRQVNKQCKRKPADVCGYEKKERNQKCFTFVKTAAQSDKRIEMK